MCQYAAKDNTSCWMLKDDKGKQDIFSGEDHKRTESRENLKQQIRIELKMFWDKDFNAP